MSVRDQLQDVGAAGEERAHLLVRSLVMEVDRRLRERTPVDTGYARGNWNIATGSPSAEVADKYEGPGPNRPKRRKDEPPPPPPPALPRDIPESVRAGEVIYLTNAVPYAERLEFGHSKQAPNGMVRVTAVEIEPLVEEIVASLGRGKIGRRRLVGPEERGFVGFINQHLPPEDQIAPGGGPSGQ